MLSLPTKQIKKDDEEDLKLFMCIIRKLRKDLSFKRKEFACFLGVRDDIYIKFETTGKASATTLFRLFIGLTNLNVNIKKLLSLKMVSEYNINDLLDDYEWFVARWKAKDTKAKLQRYKQRREENIGPPYHFEALPVNDVYFEILEYRRRYGKEPSELTEEEKEQERINKLFKFSEHIIEGDPLPEPEDEPHIIHLMNYTAEK